MLISRDQVLKRIHGQEPAVEGHFIKPAITPDGYNTDRFRPFRPLQIISLTFPSRFTVGSDLYISDAT